MESAGGNEHRAPGRPSEGARDALLEAAHDLFIQRDYDQVSTEEILQRSGVSRGALYYHFANKLLLFRAVFEMSERGVIERIAAQAPPDLTPFDRLVFLANGYLRAAETDEELRRIGLAQSRAVLGWEGWREACTDLGIGAALAGVNAAMEAGELPPRDPETTAIIMLGAMIEAAMLIITSEDPAAARKRSEEVVGDLLAGLRR